MSKVFDANSECFAKYDAFCSHIFDYARLRRKRLIAIERFETMEKLFASKIFLKLAGGRMHSPLSYPHGSAPGHKLRKSSKESAYFIHLAPLILFFFTIKESQKGRALHNGCRLRSCWQLLNELVLRINRFLVIGG